MSRETCQICNLPKISWPESKPELQAYGPFDRRGWYTTVCSPECFEACYAGNMLWMTIRFMKQVNAPISFERFVALFKFDEAGGYAREKYNMMLQSPFFFLCSLSFDKIQLLSKEIGKV